MWGVLFRAPTCTVSGRQFPLPDSYPTRMHNKGEAMPFCLCVCVGKKYWKNASSRAARTARVLEDVILNKKKKNKKTTESHWNVSVPDTSQGSSFCRYFSYFLLLVGSTPFEIAHGIYSQQFNYVHVVKYRHTGTNLACHNEDVRGVSVPW